MFQVGICDDEMEFCIELETLLLQYSECEHIPIEIDVFNSGENLLKYLYGESHLDLLFLDIEFSGMNGVEVGKELRRTMNNDLTQIVFVSSKESYAMQLFQVRPLDFLIKPVSWNKVSQVMSVYRRFYANNTVFFTYHIGKSIYRLSENDIQYFQCEGKKILAVTVKDIKRFYGKMSDVETRISADRFLTIHKSFIININYVSEFYPNQVVMNTGIKIPISQSYRKAVRERILEWNIKVRR